MQGNSNQLIWLGVVLALGLVISAFFLGGSVGQLKANSLDVTGSASTVVKADVAEWRLTATGRDASQASAYNSMQGNLASLKTYLTKNRFKPAEMSTGVVEKITYFQRDSRGYTTDTPESYEYRQTLVLETKNVDQVNKLSSKIGELVTEGVQFETNPPQYLYTKLDDIKVEMIGKATKNAKDRALQMAKSAGNAVGPLTKASTGVFQITAPNSTEVSDWGMYDTSSVEKKVTAVVNVGFALR